MLKRGLHSDVPFNLLQPGQYLITIDAIAVKSQTVIRPHPMHLYTLYTSSCLLRESVILCFIPILFEVGDHLSCQCTADFLKPSKKVLGRDVMPWTRSSLGDRRCNDGIPVKRVQEMLVRSDRYISGITAKIRDQKIKLRKYVPQCQHGEYSHKMDLRSSMSRSGINDHMISV